MQYDAIIAGAGLAGSATAAHLAARGHRVLVLEKQQYPVHKLCGEFLSVEVQALFQRLGVLDTVWAASANPILQTRITAPGGGSCLHPLPGTALGLSRYRLDDLLCRYARALGAEIHEREPVLSIGGDLVSGFAVSTNRCRYHARLVVGAYGKRSSLDRKLSRPFMGRNEPFVAFKAHFRGIELGPVIELHAFPGGYCGLSQVEDGLINACWITSAGVLRRYGGPEQMIARHFPSNAALAERFNGMERVSDRYAAVSQVSFAEKGRFDSDVCMVGDTAGMIAPLCGDGMAMALRSAELASSALSDYLSGKATPAGLRQRYEQAWRTEFRKRMVLGRIAQAGFSIPTVARYAVRCFHLLPAAATWLVHNTRGKLGIEASARILRTNEAWEKPWRGEAI